MQPRVARISLAPVKGLALVHVDRVELGPTGAVANRRFHIVDAEGRFLNGKRCGPLVRVTPVYDHDAQTLELRFPDGQVASGIVETGEPVTTDFFGRPAAGRLVVGPWSEALSGWLGQPVSLVRTDVAGAAVDRGEGAAVSLVSAASLARLAQALGLDEPVDGRRFRMLLDLEGMQAHEEDGWIGRRVVAGEATLRVGGNIGRCVVTGQDPATGEPGVDTLRALRDYRGDVPTTEPLPFGVWASVLEPGAVAVGDPVVPAV